MTNGPSHLRDLERDRPRLIAGSILGVLTLVPLMIAASLTDWTLAFVIAGFCSGAMLLFALRRRDRALLHLWSFALVFGIAELAVDWWLVHATGTLDYGPYASRGGVMWWASPAFMPFAWQVLVAHIATLLLAVSRWPIAKRLLFAVAIGAAYVPVGEELSIRAGFWIYRNVPMLSRVPLYIIVGETLVAIAIVLLMPALKRQEWPVTMAAGLVACMTLWVGYAIGLAL